MGNTHAQIPEMASADPPPEPLPEKVGAGLLFICQGEVLLLKRAADSGNPLTLGLPGGNADAEDADLMATAVREAGEEMGTALPPFTVKGRVLTKRGKRNQKHYTVFLATLDPGAKASWTPVLNEEHIGFVWLPVQEAARRNDLHPVVARVLRLQPGSQQVLAAAGLSPS